MQWYGGLGIAVLSVALLMGPHAAARRLIVNNSDPENLATTTRIQARQVLSVYIGLTLLGTVMLWLCTDDAFSALLHMLSTLSTGGFAPADGSLAALPRSGAWVVTAFSILGALPLLLYFFALRGRPGELLRDPELKALAFVLLLGAALLTASLHSFSGYDWAAAAQLGTMLGTSAQTTTGFTPLPVGGLDATSKLLLVGAMVVGGCSGSTAGGVKLLRVLVILRLLQFFVQRSGMPPHAAVQPRLAGRPLEAVDVERATLIITLFAAAAALSWLIFVASGYPSLDALFEVTSALGTVGLSTGITRPELETPLKLLLCVAMLLGRLELLALLVLLYPRTWFSRRS
jgi:trk system potassium uptake protein TrkH